MILSCLACMMRVGVFMFFGRDVVLIFRMFLTRWVRFLELDLLTVERTLSMSSVVLLVPVRNSLTARRGGGMENSGLMGRCARNLPSGTGLVQNPPAMMRAFMWSGYFWVSLMASGVENDSAMMTVCV